MRPSARQANELREISFVRNFIKHPASSVLVCYGETKVICSASFVQGVPKFLKGQGQGWLTAEYGMLPASTHSRTDREAARGRQTGRTYEIQRLIGRSLRAAVDLKLMPDYTITIDCDVIQADGGTRTASISGGCVALAEAIKVMQKRKLIKRNPMKQLIASVSVGMYEQAAVLDLDYQEDSNAETDMNVVMADNGDFIEVQGTAEAAPFSRNQLNEMLGLAESGIKQIFDAQRRIIDN